MVFLAQSLRSVPGRTWGIGPRDVAMVQRSPRGGVVKFVRNVTRGPPARMTTSQTGGPTLGTTLRTPATAIACCDGGEATRQWRRPNSVSAFPPD